MRVKFEYHLSNRQIQLFVLFLLFFTLSNAAPAQRLIIHFTKPLNSEQIQSIHTDLNQSIPLSFEFRKTSNKQSWLIIFNQSLTPEQLISFQKELLKNTLIQNIEADQLLEKKIN